MNIITVRFNLSNYLKEAIHQTLTVHICSLQTELGKSKRGRTCIDLVSWVLMVFPRVAACRRTSITACSRCCCRHRTRCLLRTRVAAHQRASTAARSRCCCRHRPRCSSRCRPPACIALTASRDLARAPQHGEISQLNKYISQVKTTAEIKIH